MYLSLLPYDIPGYPYLSYFMMLPVMSQGSGVPGHLRMSQDVSGYSYLSYLMMLLSISQGSKVSLDILGYPRMSLSVLYDSTVNIQGLRTPWIS